jgi:hypothetical protein
MQYKNSPKPSLLAPQAFAHTLASYANPSISNGIPHLSHGILANSIVISPVSNGHFFLSNGILSVCKGFSFMSLRHLPLSKGHSSLCKGIPPASKGFNLCHRIYKAASLSLTLQPL